MDTGAKWLGDSRDREVSLPPPFSCVCVFVPAFLHTLTDCPRQPSLPPSWRLFSSSTVAEPKNNMTHGASNYLHLGTQQYFWKLKDLCVDWKGLSISCLLSLKQN